MRPLHFLGFLILFTGCAAHKTITESGLRYAKIGAAMPAPGTFKAGGHAVRDTVFEDETYHWQVAAVKYPEGVVYVEEDFYGSGNIARIRVETPQLKLKNGMHTGQTVAELQAITPDWYISPMPKFKLFDFYSRLFPRVHFVVEAQNVPLDKNFEDYQISGFPVDAKVVMITIY